ncbi:hypothetical protein [Streptomyces sp. NPDC006879]|uniref:hypothetical protein n=1 Tax=Streptomyces sp. NPDC006879 TaxID=3364767 RepID=UPI00367FC102
MALRQPKPSADDPRLSGHETTYSSSRGGWVKQDRPTAGTGSSDRDSSGGRRSR